MWNIHIHTVVLELSLFAKGERIKERKKMNEIEIFTRGFLELDKYTVQYKYVQYIYSIYSKLSNKIAKGCSL